MFGNVPVELVLRYTSYPTTVDSVLAAHVKVTVLPLCVTVGVEGVAGGEAPAEPPLANADKVFVVDRIMLLVVSTTDDTATYCPVTGSISCQESSDSDVPTGRSESL